MDGGFWLGLILAVPIGILTNVLTPWVQNKAAGRSRRVRESRERARLADESLAQELNASPSRYLSFTHANSVRLLIYLLVIVALTNAPFYFWDVVDDVTYQVGVHIIIENLHLKQVSSTVTITAITVFVVLFANASRRSFRISKLVNKAASIDEAALGERGEAVAAPRKRRGAWRNATTRRGALE